MTLETSEQTPFVAADDDRLDDSSESLDDALAAESGAATTSGTAASRKGKKKKKKKARKKGRPGRRASSGSGSAAKSTGGRKKKKKSGNGRKKRGPSRKTVEKQNYIREMLRVNPGQSINQSIEAVKKKYGTTIQFERAREVHAEFGTIQRGRRGGAAVPGAAPTTTGRGRSRKSSGSPGEYLVTVAAGRGRVDARVFNSPAEVTDHVNKLTQRDGIPLSDIGFYQRFEPQISVRI